MKKIYDLVILGAGPAGLSAGLYGGRSRLSTLLIEQGRDGGQIAITSEIENYPGQKINGETGSTLIARMTEQVRTFGAERSSDTITKLVLNEPIKRLIGKKDEYLARSVIVATGAHHRPIGCINEEKFIGKGISFCATCDALFFEDLEVYVVGGGDAAVEEAVYLAKFARRVTIIHRRKELRAAKSIQEKAFATPNLHFMWDTVVVEVGGDELLSTMIVKNVKTGELTTIEADADDDFFGLFGFLGLLPNTELLVGAVDMDEKGYVKTDENMHTNIPGVFAAGDLRVKGLRQVVTAATDGAIAATEAERYLADLK
jgi:thioredoxin reductase (NADPH)